MNELDLTPMQSPDFQKNYDKASDRGVYRICAICGKPAPTAKVGVLFHTGTLDAITTGTDCDLDAMGEFPVGSDCLRRNKEVLASFIRPLSF